MPVVVEDLPFFLFVNIFVQVKDVRGAYRNAVVLHE
jgi:hypothetical protein